MQTDNSHNSFYINLCDIHSNEYNFRQLFDIDEVQKIQDAFSKATGVASIITEIDGTPITKPSGFSCFCYDVVRKTELGLKNCMKSDSILGSPKADGPRIQRCLSGGLLDGGASIMFGDKHIANWLIGQVLDDDINWDEMLKYCDKIGADRNEFVDALKKVNHMTKEKFEYVCNFLFLNAKLLSSLAIKNVQQEEEIKRRKATELLLANEKELFKVTIHSIGDAVITTDNYGKITALNEVAENLTGWKNQEAYGLPLEKVFNIINEKTRKKCTNPVSKVLATGKVVMLANHTALIAKDGTKISISDSGAPIKDKNGKIHGVVLVFRDVTEEKKKNEKIEYLSYHGKLTNLLNRAYVDHVIKKYQKSKQLPITVIVGDVNGLKLTNDIFGHGQGDKLLEQISKYIVKSCKKTDIIARWGGDEFIIILPNTTKVAAKDVCNSIRLHCNQDKVCKIKPSIALGISTKDDASQELRNIIKKAEARMYRNKLLETNSSRSGTVSSLKSTMFEKSFETEEHATRIAELSLQIAEKLGLADNEKDDLNLAAILHDIGKIAVSDEILNKPGKLDKDEWEEMKKHSEIGFRIAQSSHELSHIAEYILCHHERWDGKGYPHGRVSESIPLISRIIAVVDSYDAMISTRPYKNVVSKEDAINEIKACSGTQFDPNIAKIFIELL